MSIAGKILALAGNSGMSTVLASELPETGTKNTIYMVTGETEGGYAEITRVVVYKGDDTTPTLDTMKLDYAKLA